MEQPNAGRREPADTGTDAGDREYVSVRHQHAPGAPRALKAHFGGAVELGDTDPLSSAIRIWFLLQFGCLLN
jgi:hypothetical protein